MNHLKCRMVALVACIVNGKYKGVGNGEEERRLDAPAPPVLEPCRCEEAPIRGRGQGCKLAKGVHALDSEASACFAGERKNVLP